MTILTIVGELSADFSAYTANLVPSDFRIRSSGPHYSDYSRKSFSMKLNNATYDMRSIANQYFNQNYTFTDSSRLWVHMANKMEYNVSNANNYMYLHKPDGSILMGFNTTVWTSGHQLKFNIYGPDGSVAHQAVWSRNVYYSDSTANFDYCFDLANDEIKIYLNENLQATISAPLKENWSGSEASYLRFYILRYGALTFSQMVVADEKTVGWRVKTLTPDSAGTYQEYSGDVSDINSIALSSETANSTDTHGAKQTYQYTDVQSEIQTDMKVAAVAVETVGNSIGTLSSLSNIVIVDGEEYKLPNTTDVQSNNFGTGIVDQMDVNPRTGLAWTFDEVNSLEFGFTVEDLT